MPATLQSSNARRYDVDSRDSYVRITTKSNVHNISGRGDGITGYLDATFAEHALAHGEGVHMHVEIPVARLSSGKRAQDEQMHALIASRAFPNLVAELTTALPGDKPNQYRISGSVNVRGQSKLITGEITIGESDGRVEVTGSREFDIRMWRIEPPKFLGFAVDPHVLIELKIVLRAASVPAGSG